MMMTRPKIDYLERSRPIGYELIAVAYAPLTILMSKGQTQRQYY